MEDKIIAILKKHERTLPARDPGSFYTALPSTDFKAAAKEIAALLSEDKNK